MLRPYQTQACGLVAGFLATPPARRLMVAPPGVGKTVLIAQAARIAYDALGGKTLVIVHRQELVHQIAARVREFAPGLAVGVEMAEESAPQGSQVVVASVQSIGGVRSSRLSWFAPSLIVTDEAHRASAPSYRRAVQRIAPNAHALGFTATPDRTTGVPLMGHDDSPYDAVLWEYPILQAVEEGWLADLRGWVVKTQTNLDRVRIVDGDFNERDLAETVDTETRTAACFKAWLDLAADRRTLAFCASVAHAQSVAEFWKSQGVSAAAVWGDMDPKAREEALKRFRDGRTRVLTNCALLTEGVDYPAIDCVLMMRPTRSRTLFVQSIGRGMRLHPGKDHCVVIDVVDATKRNDLVTLPSFAGLPMRTDLQGATFQLASAEAERLELPEATRSESMTLEELRMRVVEVQMLRQQEAARASAAQISATVSNCVTCGREIREYPDRGAMRQYCSQLCKLNVIASMIGKTYGELTVIAEGRRTERGRRTVSCRCSCGKTFDIEARHLRSGTSGSCGCKKGERISGHHRMDLAGQRFGRLVAVRMIPGGKGHARWVCACDCGKEATVASSNLTRGTISSCGCLRRDRAVEWGKTARRLANDALGVSRPASAPA